MPDSLVLPSHSAAGAADELKHQNDALDEALRESFPASDPIAVSITVVPDAAIGADPAHPDDASARKE